MNERNGRPGRRYDEMEQQNQSPVVTDEMVEAAQKSIRENPVAHDHPNTIRDALEAALSSGVKVTDDLADKLCQAITHSGALMYQEQIVAVQDVIRKTLAAIEPTHGPQPSLDEKVRLAVERFNSFSPEEHTAFIWQAMIQSAKDGK